MPADEWAKAPGSSRLLLPADTAGSVKAEREAARRLAAWLERRPQLGREVFARGAPEQEATAEPAADVTALLRACLRLLEVSVHERVYRPRPPALYRVPEAMERIQAMLPELPADGIRLERLLPPAPEGEGTVLWRRSALASTLLASLELSREGSVMMEQKMAFDVVLIGQRLPAIAVGAQRR